MGLKQVIRCKYCQHIIYFRNKNDKDNGTYSCYYCKRKDMKEVIFDTVKRDFSDRKKRSMIQQEVWSPSKILEVLNSISNKRDKALIAFLYLTGSRIEEVTGVRKPLSLITNDEKNILSSKGKVLRRRKKNMIEYIIEPIRKDQIIVKFYNEIKYIEIKNMAVLKKRDKKISYDLEFNKITQTATKRNVPIIYELENKFWDIIQEYIDTLGDRDYLFPISYSWAYRITRKHTNLFNHYWRHCRTTHLKEYMDFDGSDLREFFKWADERPASNYSHIGSKSILKKMISGVKNNG